MYVNILKINLWKKIDVNERATLNITMANYLKLSKTRTQQTFVWCLYFFYLPAKKNPNLQSLYKPNTQCIEVYFRRTKVGSKIGF